jgi:alkylhydroperoxidase family enzyme
MPTPQRVRDRWSALGPRPGRARRARAEVIEALRALVPAADTPVRVPPGDRHQLGLLNLVLATVISRAAGEPPLHVFTTLGRHRRLFRSWLRFSGRLMPFGRLPRREAEQVILRTAYLCGSAYEWHQHVVLGQRAGLAPDEIRALAAPLAPAAGRSPRDAAILAVVDELHSTRRLADGTWAAVSAVLDTTELLELLMLAGQYSALAGTLNALGVRPEGRPGR